MILVFILFFLNELYNYSYHIIIIAKLSSTIQNGSFNKYSLVVNKDNEV